MNMFECLLGLKGLVLEMNYREERCFEVYLFFHFMTIFIILNQRKQTAF